MTTRTQLRSQLRQARRNLSENEQEIAANQLLTQLLTHPNSPMTKLTAKDRVALYLANDGEISPHHICHWLWQHKIPTYLPSIKGESLVFAHYHQDSEWQNNQFNIPEPLDNQPLLASDLSLVFMPLVGYDLNGGRLGMGGGFYDKTFAQHQTQLIGLAHRCQQVPQLPLASWDVPLNGIATDQTFIQISTNRTHQD